MSTKQIGRLAITRNRDNSYTFTISGHSTVLPVYSMAALIRFLNEEGAPLDDPEQTTNKPQPHTRARVRPVQPVGPSVRSRRRPRGGDTELDT